MPKTRSETLWRSAAAALMVIGLVAVMVTVGGLNQLARVAHAVGHHKAIGGLTGTGSGEQVPAAGQPQTILLIGSDHRAGDPYTDARTDTMLLMRLNAASSTINVLSIPRDLQVQLPEGGTSVTGKINAAYTLGGPAALLKVIRTQVFPGFHVNHVIDVNFAGFSQLIDAIGCVYTDVDHRYFNLSSPGLDNYSSINIQPGYQRLCGDNQADTGALAFVRFRHTDSDFVRNARQQDFVRWAKENFSGSELFDNYLKLATIFGDNAQTDASLHTGDGIENLAVLLAHSGPMRSVPFPGTTTPNCGGTVTCYVQSTAAQEAAAYKALMTPTHRSGTSRPAARRAPAGATRPHAGSSGLIADPHDGGLQAVALGRSGLPVYYPRLIAGPDSSSSIGSQYCSSISENCNEPSEPATAYIHAYPRQYVIHGTGGTAYKSYAMTLVLNAQLGLYYTVQGTTWKTPPILRSPTQSETIGGRRLDEYFNGAGKLSLVAWHTPTAVYWIANTLTDTLPPAQMKAIAASLTLGPSSR